MFVPNVIDVTVRTYQRQTLHNCMFLRHRRMVDLSRVDVKQSESAGNFDIIYKEHDKSTRKATFSDMGDAEMLEVVTELQYQISLSVAS